MKKLFAAAALAAGLAFAPANAAVIDFANDADTNGERGVATGTVVNVDGFDLQLNSFPSILSNSNNIPGAGGNPYFDAGNAGLGVCQMLDGNAQCDPGSDDSIQQVMGANGPEVEGIGINFLSGPVTITDLVFVDGAHNMINAMNDGLVDFYSSKGAGPGGFVGTFSFSQLVTLATSGDAIFQDVGGVGFVFVDTAFYVSALTVSDVPIPGAIPLLLSGLAGLGFASRKKKAA